MNTTSILLGGLNIFCGLVIFLLCVPLAKGLIKRNKTYGFRFKKTMTSNDAWKECNVYGGKRMLAYSAGIMLIGILILFVPINDPATILIASLVPMIVLIPAFDTWMYSRRLDIEMKEEEETDRQFVD